MEVLKTVCLTIGYPNKIIKKDINIALNSGEMVCLLGQNGVGKSTLMRTLANLQPAISGELLLDSHMISSLDRSAIARKLGIVTTEKIGVSNMTVRNLVSLGRHPYTDWWGKEKKEDKEKIEWAIDTCRINFIEHMKLGELSDGQFQKVMIARALAQDTDVILLDEPTAHLDVVNRYEIFQLLSGIKEKENKAIVISTHEIDLSAKFADKLWLMDFNEPLVTGRTQELISKGAIQKIFHLDGKEIDISHLLK